MSDAIQDALEEYLTYQRAMGFFVESTVAAVRSDFRGLFRYMSDSSNPPLLSNFTVRVMGDYFSGRRKTVRDTTLKRWHKSFNGFGQWAAERGYIAKNPMSIVKVGWVQSRRREFLFDHDAAYRFLTISVRTNLTPQVDHALRHLALFAGLRRNELLKLRWRHVDLPRKILEIYDTKGTRRKGHPANLDRYAPMCSALVRSIAQLRDVVNPGPDDPVLTNPNGRPISKESLYLVFHGIRTSMGLSDEFVPHSVRHSLAGNLVALGATSADVALLLGHSSMDPQGRATTTDRYITSSLTRLRGFLEHYAEVLAAVGTPGDQLVGRQEDGQEAFRTQAPVAPNAYPSRRLLSAPPARVQNWDIPHHIEEEKHSSRSEIGAFPPAVVGRAAAAFTSLYPEMSLTSVEFTQFLGMFATAGRTGRTI